LCRVVETKSFVKLLFEMLSSGEYDAELKAKRAAAKSAAPATKDPSIVRVTWVPASYSVYSVNSRGDVDYRPSRPDAVVQPLVAGSNETTKDKDYRQGDVYRPGQDAHHHRDHQQRRDWKRRSPQRTV